MSRGKKRPAAERVLDESEATLLDLLDDVISKGVLLDGEIVLGVADVDLVYLRLSTVLAAADRVLRDLDRPAPRAREHVMAARIPSLAVPPRAGGKKKRKRRSPR